VPETFDSAMRPAAQGSDDVYAVKLRSPFDVLYYLPPRRAGVFPLQTSIYAAFVNVNAFVLGNSF